MRGFGIAALAALALLTACHEPREELEEDPAWSSPMVVANQLVWLGNGNSKLAWFDAGATKPVARTTRETLPGRPRTAAARGDGKELLVLCEGDGTGSANDTNTDASILVAAAPGKDQRVYPLGSAYTKLYQSEDGRYALVTTEGSSSESIISNANDISVVDLGAAPSESNPAQRTLSSDGGTPHGVLFTPVLTVGDSTKRLAIVLYDGSVTLLDLEHRDRPAFKVPLSSDAALQVAGVSYAPQSGRIYLYGTSSSDVFELQLLPSSGTSRQNDYFPSLNQLGAGGTITALGNYELGGSQYVVAARSAATTLVLDTQSGASVEVPTMMGASKVDIYDRDPDTDAGLTAVLMGGDDAVSFINLDTVLKRPENSVQTLPLKSVPSQMVVSGDGRVTLVMLNSGLTVLDEAAGDLFPLNTFGVVDQTPLYDAQTNAMWLGISGNTQVAYFDLAGLHPRTLELDWPVLQLLHVGGKTPRIVAVHPGADGDVTLIDAKSPSTDSAQGLRGLLISELLEEGK